MIPEPPQAFGRPDMAGPQQASSVGRMRPHDKEAEQSVLGALMLDPNAVATVRDVLQPGDFYEDRHAHIFAAALELSDRGEPIDPITLRAQLERAGTLPRSGGVEYIAELSTVTPTAASVKHYADIVVQHAVRRRLIDAGARVTETGFDDQLRVEDALDMAEQIVFRISDQRSTNEATHIAPVLKETWSQLETLLGGQRFITGVPTNFSELDNVTQGLQSGELIILAARPSVGKTSFALNMARNAAVLGKRPVAVFSLEMSKESLVQRLLCSEAHVDSFLLKTGQADAAAFSRIAQAMDRLTQAELWIDDTPALSISAMRSRARRMKAQHKVALIIVDYLQLMHGGRQESRVQEVSDISSGLKSIAKELQIPIVALSQLSRESERRTDRRPQLSDLRDSGCLAGSSPVFLPDEGRCRPIRDLVGRSGFRVLALDATTWKLVPREVLKAFPTGRREVFDLTTRLGRTVRATANHKFLTLQGWKRLDELAPGDHLALPRRLPTRPEPTMTDAELALLGHLIGDGCTLPRHAIQYTTADHDLAQRVTILVRKVFGDAVSPRVVRERSWYQVYLAAGGRLTHGRRNPVAAWLDRLGVFGLRSHEKYVPTAVFEQPAEQIGVFLRHLWSTDGCIHAGDAERPEPIVYYATSSARLALDVQSMLLRLGLNARVVTVPQGTKGRVQHHVVLRGYADVVDFLDQVGALRPSAMGHAALIFRRSASVVSRTNRDVIPAAVWQQFVMPAMATSGMSQRAFAASLGHAHSATAVRVSNLSRSRASRIADAVQSESLLRLSASDVYWDPVATIIPAGMEDVYDLTVEDLHNFVVSDIISHNSIEQDADIVLFLYREGMHNQEVDKSLTQLIVAKNRNGPVRDIDLVFVAEQTAFREPFRGRPE
jgi:replicative DNA helicase